MKMFYKFPKIQNLDNTDWFPTPEEIKVKDMKFYVSEKVDGCNIGLYINNEIGSFSWSRNGNDANSLYEFENDKHKLTRFIAKVKAMLAAGIFGEGVEAVYVNLEYFGRKIMRRIPYTTDGDFVVLEVSRIYSDDSKHPMSVKEMESLMSSVSEIELVPIWECCFEVPTVQKLLDHYIPRRFCSDLVKIGDDDSPEGYVVSAYDNEGNVHRWKIKDERFEEKARTRKKFLDIVDDEFGSARKEFESYITVNRALNVLTKTPEREMKVLLPMFIKDATEDFLHDHPEYKVQNKKWLKGVTNVGKKPFTTMSAALKETK